MLVPLKWLKEYVTIEQSPEELAKIINSKILEVENIHYFGKEIKGVIVAEIKEVQKHPNADKLHVLKVDNGKEILQIVCGAQNVASNKKVALAQIGAVLPGGFEIKQAKIRNVESFGMCCSEKELGLAEESAGIMLLPDDAPLGKDFVKYMGLDDVVLELAILPNRGDCQSLKAIAQEVHAATGGRLNLPIIKKGARQSTENKTQITIKDEDLCGRYMGAILQVNIRPSPDWLQKHLKSVGLRPINNIVDITNFILYELGQPLHAFDYDKLKGGEIIVRRAKKGEKFLSLENKTYDLTSDMLVIADAEAPVALAGIMGGGNSCVEANTKTILLEAAYFNPVAIRKTSRATGIRTDSSVRFEKFISYDGVEDGFYRAINLFYELADAKLISNIVDQDPGRPKPVLISFSPERANQVLGTKLSEAKMLGILKNLQFRVDNTGKQIKVLVPAARVHDVYREIDLIEEIARMIGYDAIPTTIPNLIVGTLEKNKKESVEEITRAILLASGLNETLSYSMTSPEIYKNLNLDLKFSEEIKLANPLSYEESVLRQYLLPQLFQALELNLSQQVQDVALFQLGKVYKNNEERTKLAGICYGGITSGNINKTSKQDADFYLVKGILENLLERLGINNKKINPAINPFVHPGKSLEIRPLLFMGELNPLVAAKMGLLKPAYVFEIDFEQLVLMAKFQKEFTNLPIYPSARRDIAFLIDKKIQAIEVEKVIRSAAEDIVENVELFDYYTGENIPAGKINMAYAITYRSKDRTLKDEEINAVQEKIAKTLVVELGIEFR